MSPSLSIGIAFGPEDSRHDRTRSAPSGMALTREQENVACANLGFTPVVLASLALWGLIGLSINWALHI